MQDLSYKEKKTVLILDMIFPQDLFIHLNHFYALDTIKVDFF